MNKIVYAAESKARDKLRRLADIFSMISPKREKEAITKPLRIGVLLQWGIGDSVLALPLLQGLYEAYPEASIEVIGHPWLADLFIGEPWFDHLHVLVPPWTNYDKKYLFWKKEWRQFIRQLNILRRIRFDLVIGLRLDPRELLQFRFINAKKTAGFSSAGGRGWVTHDLGLSKEEYYNRHRSEISVYALKIITGLSKSSIPCFFVDYEKRTKAFIQLINAGYKDGIILAVHAGAGHLVRNWGSDNFSEVLKTLPNNLGMIIIIDYKGESLDIKVPESMPSLVLRTGLVDLKSFLSICDIVLCSDSGFMHIAAACGCKVVAIFGPQLKEWFGPCGEGHEIISEEPMPCRPCYDNCIFASPICMERIPIKKVTEALNRVCLSLNKSRSYSEFLSK